MHLRRLIVAVVILFSLTGCPVSEYISDYSIEPRGPASVDGVPTGGEWDTFTFEGVNDFIAGRFIDELIRVDVALRSPAVSLELENLSSDPIEIRWSEARLEGDFAADLLRADSGERDELEIPQAATLLAPGETQRSKLIVKGGERWQPFTDSETRGFWAGGRPLFDLDVAHAVDEEARAELAARAIGIEADLVLPMRIDGRERLLRLPFRVVDASVRPSYY